MMRPATSARSGGRIGRLGSILAVLSTLALASPALAQPAVGLRADAAGHAGVVTLGDLFDGLEGPAAAKVVGRGVVGQQLVLDAGEVQLAARAAGFDWPNSAGQRQIIVEVVQAAGDGSTAAHPRRRPRAAQVLVYARNISVGEIIQASDLQWSEDAVAGSDAPNDPTAVIGLAARMPLRSGAAIAARDLIAPKVVRRDQMISVDYATDGVSLSLSAKAMGDAAAGEPLQVMNLSSKKIIDAVATAPGHAAVGPGADAVRSAAPGGFRTAALP